MVGNQRHERRFEFFEQLLYKCSQKTSIFENVSPVGYQNWVSAGAGKAGVVWQLVAWDTVARAELYLMEPDPEIHRGRFEALRMHKEEIERSFGEPLQWNFIEARKQQYISSLSPFDGISNQDKWQAIQDDLVDRLVRMERAFRAPLDELD